MDNEKMNQGHSEPGYTPPVNEQSPYQQSPYQQSPYQQSSYQQPESNLEEPVTLGEWMVAFLLLLIPCVNFILPFVWAFSKKEKKSKSNFFKAYLIFSAVLVAIYLVVVIIMAIAMSVYGFSGYPGYY